MQDDNVSQTNRAAFTGTPTSAVGEQIGGEGGDVAHTNRDKFYALAYIMKT
jgi:hypothetical protein